MKREMEGRLSRLEDRAGRVGFTSEQWRKLESLFSDEPEPPELRHVTIPIELIRSLFDEEND